MSSRLEKLEKQEITQAMRLELSPMKVKKGEEEPEGDVVS